MRSREARSPIDFAGTRTSPTKSERPTVSAVFRKASAGTSNGLGTSAAFDLNPAMAVSIAFSFRATLVAVPPKAVWTVNASAAAEGRNAFEACESVM